MVAEEKLITVGELNDRIKCAKLSKRDSRNRPKNFKIRKPNSKYEGNAGSFRILSRMLPLILLEELAVSDVGEAAMKLEEVCQLAVAPKLTYEEIDNYLHFSIVEYLDLRVKLIEDIGAPSVRPKHHFLSHYAQLYLENGPLINLWAMRMESKGNGMHSLKSH